VRELLVIHMLVLLRNVSIKFVIIFLKRKNGFLRLKTKFILNPKMISFNLLIVK